MLKRIYNTLFILKLLPNGCLLRIITLFIPFLLLAAASTGSFAQNSGRVLGKVTDSTGAAVANAVIALVDNRDTLRVITNKDGGFSFDKVKSENVAVIITATNFETVTHSCTLGKDRLADLGVIALKPAYNVLKEVIIKSTPNPVKVMQDTIEFNAAAFRVVEGDNVADLIKQFQGMEVDNDYNTTFMGEEVVKIRVNGKDFFTSNVKEFLARLPAEIVSKIQVIDDYGDLAGFTGVKTGTPRKMLNVVTKAGMNRGDFGNMAVSGGTNRQLGTWNEMRRWRGDKQTGVRVNYSIENNGAGQSENSGVMLSHRDKFRGKGSLNFNYNLNQSSNDYLSEQAVETVSSIGTYYNNAHSQGKTKNASHSLSSEFTNVTGTTYLNGSVKAGYSRQQSQSDVINNQSGVVKQDFNNLSNNSSRSPDVRADFSLSGKAKGGRVLTGQLALYRTAQYSDQLIRTQTRYYDQQNGQLLKDSLLSRNLENKNISQGLDFNTHYVISLRQDSTGRFGSRIMLQYNLSVAATENASSTYVLNAGAKYGFVDSLSTAFSSLFVRQSIAANYYYSSPKNRILLGVVARPVILSNHYEQLNQRINNNSFNYSPLFNFSRTIGGGKTVSLAYNGDNNSPSPSQLRPVRNTQNLQNITIGNPDLKPYFQHRLKADYRFAAMQSGLSFFVSASFATTQNEIVQNVVIIPDTLGSYKQETRFLNTNGSWNLSSNYSLTIPIKKNAHRISYEGNAGVNNRPVFVNNVRYFNKGLDMSHSIIAHLYFKKLTVTGKLNYTRSNNNSITGMMNGAGGVPTTFNPGQFASTSFFTSQKFGADVQARLRYSAWGIESDVNYTYSTNTNSRVANSNRTLTVLAMGLRGDVTIQKRFRLSANASKRINIGYALANSNPFLLGFSLNYLMLKDRTLRVGITGSDLLAQGNLISRQVNGNSVIDSKSNVATRVFTLGVQYNISRFGSQRKHFRVDPD